MTRAAPPPAPVPLGLVAYRQRLRRRGPLVALVPPLVAAALAVAVWRFWPCSGSTCTVRAVIGWSLASLAVPTALIAGVPFNGGGARYALVVASSIALVARDRAARGAAGDTVCPRPTGTTSVANISGSPCRCGSA